jgi:hypothetical protein
MRVADAPYDQAFPVVADAAGRAVARIQSQGNRPWLLSQVSIEMVDAPAGASCTLRKNGAFVSAMIAPGDAAGGDPPLTLHPGDTVTVEWTGLTPGSQGVVFVVYNQLTYGE